MVGTTEERAANGLEMVFPVWALVPRNGAAIDGDTHDKRYKR